MLNKLAKVKVMSVGTGLYIFTWIQTRHTSGVDQHSVYLLIESDGNPQCPQSFSTFLFGT